MLVFLILGWVSLIYITSFPTKVTKTSTPLAVLAFICLVLASWVFLHTRDRIYYPSPSITLYNEPVHSQLIELRAYAKVHNGNKYWYDFHGQSILFCGEGLYSQDSLDELRKNCILIEIPSEKANLLDKSANAKEWIADKPRFFNHNEHWATTDDITEKWVRNYERDIYYIILPKINLEQIMPSITEEVTPSIYELIMPSIKP